MSGFFATPNPLGILIGFPLTLLALFVAVLNQLINLVLGLPTQSPI